MARRNWRANLRYGSIRGRVEIGQGETLRRLSSTLIAAVLCLALGFGRLAIWSPRASGAVGADRNWCPRRQRRLHHAKPAEPGPKCSAGKRPVCGQAGRQYRLGGASLCSADFLSDFDRVGGGHAQSQRRSPGTFLKAGQQVVIPGMLDAPIVEKSVPVAKDFEVRAVYLTGLMAGSDHGMRIIRHWREVGGNAVVFDIKDSDGSVNIPFENPLIGSHHTPIRDLPKFVRFLHSQNMHAIARVAIFRDERLVVAHPELAVKSHKTGQPWRENGKLVWTDPSQPKVQEYDIALAKKAAEAGADEIQFDYVRFPAEGDQKDASFRISRPSIRSGIART